MARTFAAGCSPSRTARRWTTIAPAGRRPIPVERAAEVAVAGPEPDLGIWDRVGSLPPKQRAAVTLRYACDLPHGEIAAALDCSPEAARRSLHEGLKRLRREMA